MPRPPRLRAAEPLAPDADDSQDRRVSVVIADDNRRLAEVLRSLLDEEPGFAVAAVAGNAAEAVMATSQHCPDLVVLDADLTADDELALVARLRSAHRGTRIVIWASAEDPTERTHAAVDGYVLKGDTFRAFVAGLRDALDADGSATAAEGSGGR